MTAIQTDLTEAIDKHLPGMVGEQLRKRLDQADQDAKDKATLLEQLASRDATIRDKNKAIESLESQLKDHAALDVREKVVAERERVAEITELKIQLVAEQRYGESVTGAMLGLVRNTEFRKSMVGNAVAGAGGSSTCVGYVGSAPVNETETNTAT